MRNNSNYLALVTIVYMLFSLSLFLSSRFTEKMLRVTDSPHPRTDARFHPSISLHLPVLTPLPPSGEDVTSGGLLQRHTTTWDEDLLMKLLPWNL